MKSESSLIGVAVDLGECLECPQDIVGAICRCGLNGCRRMLTWPPDPLTKLLMQADNVSERELDAILQKVVDARAGWR